MDEVQPSHKPPVAKTVKKYLKMEYIEEKTALKSDLGDQVAVGVTSDLWTSAATQGYITATGHYITKDWELKHCVLATRRMTDRHSGKNINQALNGIYKDYEIQSKIAGLTIDNASNMKVAGALHQYCTDPDASCNCFAHTLQLAVSDGLDQEVIKEISKKGRAIVTHFHHSVVASDALEKFQKSKQQEAVGLIQDVDTRWNSLYFMLERLQRLRSEIYVTLHDKQITKPSVAKNLELPDEMWTNIECLLPALLPFVEATEILASEAYPSLSAVMPLIVNLSKYFLSVNDTDIEIIRVFKEKVLSGLKKRYTLPSDPKFHETTAAVASVLDPRHKSLKYIESGNVRDAIKNKLLMILKSAEDTQNDTPQPEQIEITSEPTEEPPTKRQAVLSFVQGDVFDVDENIQVRQSDLETELTSYLAEPVYIKDPLVWWKHNENRFPKIAAQARKYLCIMGTSVPSERVFSVAGLTVTKTRASLDSDTVDELIFLNKVKRQKLKNEGAGSKDATNVIKIKQEIGQEGNGSASAIAGPSTIDTVDNDEDPPLPSLY